MKPRQLYLLICLLLVLVNLLAVYFENLWVAKFCQILVFIPLIIAYKRKLDFRNWNLVGFFSLSLFAIISTFFYEIDSMQLINIMLSLIAYGFLSREALKHTERKSANNLMLLFFFVLIIGNVYFVYQHVQELEIYMAGIVDFWMYTIYYLNLFVLSIVALIYYLNSYSRKSVLFITLVMALIVSDILRDMALFYLPDTSVLLMKNFLSISAIILSFQFFTTREKKLRLINLV